MFRAPARDAHGQRLESHGALLLLESDGQNSGTGELCPLPGRSRETLAECVDALRRLPLGELPSRDSLVPTRWREAVERASALLPAAMPAARHALESALLDLSAAALGQPAPEFLARVLGLPAPEGTLPVAALVDARSLAEALDQAGAALASGMATIKVKIAGDESDAGIVDRIGMLRHEFGDSLRMRVDANQSLEAGRALLLARKLEALNVEF
ncbi:MAG TPA: mandelate racemase/muconate lactonizing enzyme family protein, partial [Polyangiaceae bacterium]|nr:mandelate racemase/muconate lactonizing enzyme family protein [Polyangiaceae bacterium]